MCVRGQGALNIIIICRGEGKTLAKHGATNCLPMLFCNLEMGRVGCVIVCVSVCVEGVRGGGA